MGNEVLNVKKNRLSIYLYFTAMCACVFTVALGLVVLVGWYIHNETMIQVIPSGVLLSIALVLMVYFAQISNRHTKEAMKVNQILADEITEHKQAEKALKVSDEKFTTIGTTANDSIIMIDNDNCISFWNNASERLFGFSEKEMHGKKIHETIIPNNFRAGHIKGFKAFRDTGQGPIIGKTMEFAAIHKDGREFPIELSLSAVKIKEKWNAIGIIRNISERKQAEVHIKQGIKKLKSTINGIIETLALTVEQRDPYTAGHQYRVSKLSCAIAEEMGLSENQIDGIRTAGVLHDIGKMRIPAEFLSRPGKLTKSEFDICKTHTHIGYDILKGIEFPWPIADIVNQHHEKLDGSGYHLGLSNGDIRIEARILCVADVVEAMASHRPYRPALGMDMALDEITMHKGVKFDSVVVDACLNVIKEKKFVLEEPKVTEAS
jgi:PAS domain S-box-containing protein/putative nucleotidyltransferase with HDIG domain